MKRNFWLRKLPLALLVCGLVFTAAAWQVQPGAAKHNPTDTIPKPGNKVRDIDEALKEIERARIELEQTLKDKNWEQEIDRALKQIDGAKIQAQMEKAMAELDAAKIQSEVQKALKEADFEKIQKELQQSLKEIDSEKIRAEMEKAVKDIDLARIKAEAEASVAKIDIEKVKGEMEKIKEIDFKKMEEEIKQIRPTIEKSLEEARAGLEEAKKELTAYKTFIDGLAQDGLINKNEKYTIEYRNGTLIINGKKQTEEVVKKYQGFLKDRKDFTIKKDADEFNIDRD